MTQPNDRPIGQARLAIKRLLDTHPECACVLRQALDAVIRAEGQEPGEA